MKKEKPTFGDLKLGTLIKLQSLGGYVFGIVTEKTQRAAHIFFVYQNLQPKIQGSSFTRTFTYSSFHRVPTGWKIFE